MNPVIKSVINIKSVNFAVRKFVRKCVFGLGEKRPKCRRIYSSYASGANFSEGGAATAGALARYRCYKNPANYVWGHSMINHPKFLKKLIMVSQIFLILTRLLEPYEES